MEDGLAYDIPEESGVYPTQAHVQQEAAALAALDFDGWASAEVDAAQVELAAEAAPLEVPWALDCQELERRARAADDEPNDPKRIWELAEARLRFGAPRGAADDCTRAIALRPSAHQAFEIRGRARHSLGDLEGALADFDRALRLDPRFGQALERRALVRLEMGDATGAIDDLDLAIAIDSRSGALFRRRAEARVASGDRRGALDDLNVAIAIDPRDPEALHLRGVLREALGRSGATADRQRAVLALARSIARVRKAADR